MAVKVRKSRRPSARVSMRKSMSPKRVQKRQSRKTVKKVKTPARRPRRVITKARKAKIAKLISSLSPETRARLKAISQRYASSM